MQVHLESSSTTNYAWSQVCINSQAAKYHATRSHVKLHTASDDQTYGAVQQCQKQHRQVKNAHSLL